MREMARDAFFDGMVSDDQPLELIKKLLYLKKGIELECYKSNFVKRRIAARMQSIGIRTLKQYLQFLSANSAERHLLCHSFSNQTTHFFRNPGTFQLLREKILPSLISRKSKDDNRRLNFWSAGCATGEEPYSLAVLLNEILGVDLGGFEIYILASDLDEKALSRARGGVFQPNRLKEVGSRLLSKYFYLKNGNFCLADKIKRMVSFDKQDICRKKRLCENFDMIICRNLLIYFSAKKQRSLISYFHGALNKGGIMLLGKTELLPRTEEGFAPVNIEERIYQKIDKINREEAFYEK